MKPEDIVVGRTYKMRGAVKPRTVKSYNPRALLAGGIVRTSSGQTKSGREAQWDTWAGERFVVEVLEPTDD